MRLSDAGLERLYDAVVGHTPLPWWNESGILHATNSIGGTMHPARCENEADAKLIERAVNSYEAMLGALEQALTYLPDGGDPALHKFWQAWIPVAHDAIKLAQKGK